VTETIRGVLMRKVEVCSVWASMGAMMWICCYGMAFGLYGYS
jgi:hypothetical protein